ncbi:BID domain-containing T4SS effector [Bartonella phoceensis]|uniref:BID domain-containing T4SS effector n=1 Tax=Bartonella phoceensis TaxID=270249 RepID=UPI001ABA1482|nr:BID domain-containing T4SS effector [Bartonella phoceensis]
MKKHHQHSSEKRKLENSRASASSQSEEGVFALEKGKEISLTEGIVVGDKSEKAKILSQRIGSALSDEEITRLISHNPLVKACEEEISRWSDLVFGKRDILQEKVEEIRGNPALGADLSWQLLGYPSNLSKFAGTNVCGIKNGARKQAEKSLPFLCDVVKCYTEAVRLARDDLSHSPQEELGRYERHIGTRAMSQILKTPYHSGDSQEFLSDAEVIEMAQQRSAVRRYQERIKYWCGIVFGKQGVLNEQIECIFENPSVGARLTQQLTENCQSFHKLAGMECCGFKDRVRRHAEAGFPQLLNAIDSFADTVEQVKASILQEHQEKQERREQSAELAGTSRHERERVQSVQPRKVSESKTLALAS